MDKKFLLIHIQDCCAKGLNLKTACTGWSYYHPDSIFFFSDLEVLKFETAEGVPDHPVQLTIGKIYRKIYLVYVLISRKKLFCHYLLFFSIIIDKISVDGAMLEWKQPENRNGIIDNYKIEITKNCPEYAVS